MTHHNYRNAKRNRAREEQDAPRIKDAITPSDVARTRALSGPVKQWKDMTPAERQRVMEQLRPRGVRP